ncbi:MAG: hypothetical protein HQL55_15055 [Magnetococcales bacterium]|nr:hypothetical protein [Magnetococcales bacterium]
MNRNSSGADIVLSDDFDASLEEVMNTQEMVAEQYLGLMVGDSSVFDASVISHNLTISPDEVQIGAYSSL